jgi:hypothetical protein
VSDYVPNHLPGQNVTYVAGGTITGGQVVILSATGRVVTVAGAGARNTVGIACHDVVSGQAVTVSRGGEQRPVASGAITAGALVKTGAAGTVAAFVPGTDAIDLIVGTALTTVADTVPVDVAWRA